MKRIVTLLAVLLVDLLVVGTVTASDGVTSFDLVTPFLLLFLTAITVFFLFYVQDYSRFHERMQSIAPVMRAKMSGAPSSLELQYQLMDLVKNQIVEMKDQGQSDSQVIKVLRAQKWDPNVISVAMSRVRRDHD
ncbi:MAG: hypothetical protein ABIH41_06835 [Nanoarchaeota archaeon]